MFTRRNRQSAAPRAPRGHRAYAIGDIHGRLDLLDQLLGKIEADLRNRPDRMTMLVFLGDLIDRGPDSRGVVERLRSYHPQGIRTCFLAGNHEEVLLRLIRRERGILSSWLKFGGAECLASYGLDPAQLEQGNESSALSVIKQVIPETHIRFIERFADTLTFGDYLFVHAGMRPGVELPLQTQTDLRWIRSPFLEDESDHGKVVVHGHTICDSVEWRPNRIGIDTGAYRTGVLTALGLEGDDRWTLDTADETGTETAQVDFGLVDG